MLLSEAINHAKRRWKGMRKEPTYLCWVDAFQTAMQAYPTMDAITYDVLVIHFDSLQVSPATVYARVSTVSVLYQEAKRHGYQGPVPVMPYPRVPRKLKWWLNPTQQQEAIQWLHQRINTASTLTRSSPSFATWQDLRDYILWTTETGLRVEETLRLERSHFSTDTQGMPQVTIPGTKTAEAQATLPLSQEAWDLAMRRFYATTTGSATQLFPMTYLTLYRKWSAMTLALGWKDASLKALRRSYARARASKGCPLPQLAQLMRHRDINTTLEYLRLTGGQFGTQELRQWL